ncbi:MAG: DNA/RNA non-specific endonuclease, partial [Steroidobacteraceae bacterium]|nr:DNA/RNA non-specific endonuclease [Steroidobacteraceae bacterium]
MKVPASIERAARARIQGNDPQIKHSLEMVRQGVPLKAEPEQERLVARLQKKMPITREVAAELAREVTDGSRTTLSRAERIYGKTVDFVGVSFLERGYVSARAVARVAFRSGQALGSGFLISDRLFVTNNHVIGSARDAAGLAMEFDYERDRRGQVSGITRFAFDPKLFFYTNHEDNLDFTVIGVGPRIDGNKSISAFGWCQLSGAANKHALGECANIVQHPDGRYKEVVLRENRLVSRLSTVLHYVADTEPGSSGSPVFNNEWLVIALHHWGGPWRQTKDDAGKAVPLEVNEGIRASAIVEDLRSKLGTFGPAQRDMVRKAISGDEAQDPPRAVVATPDSVSSNPNGPQIEADGTATWRIPVELSVRLPTWAQSTAAPLEPSAAAAAPVDDDSAGEAAPSPDYDARSGYKPTFISGLTVPLPRLTDAISGDAAPNLQGDDDEIELKYHHFSVVMNRKRRLAFFTASNIDGKKAKKVDRDTGLVSPLLPKDVGHESLGGEAAEASETWYVDPRIDEAEQTDQSVFSKQNVAGFPTNSGGRLARMLQRGHLVRRMDPAWGTDSQALDADADTFHFTNCTPQLGFFNMGSAKKLNLGISGGGRLWRALEDHVLGGAVVDKRRICCFTGPVFGTKDPKFRDLRVPMRFWKIAVWAVKGKLHSLAMLANQAPVLK